MPGSECSFDILDPALDIKKNYFLEASAGTGKTFTIENCVVRLIQEGIPLEKILVVTFTRAATLELKTRIRKNLEGKKLYKALFGFDEAKIFTLHGFCFHTLKEYALEAGFPLDQSEESPSIETFKRIFKDFLRTEITAEEIHPQQLEKILSKHETGLEQLLNELRLDKQAPGRAYNEIVLDIKNEVSRLGLKSQSALEALLEAAPSFKRMCDRRKKLKSEVILGLHRSVGIFEGKFEHLIDLPLIEMIPENLLQSKGSYPPFLEKINERLIPLLREISDKEAILNYLRGRFHPFLRHVCNQEDLFFYDDLLKQMHKLIQQESFASKVRSSYQAVLIDEFQDTDAIQWEIFSTLFLNRIPLYLVGDPKQSIYRFRGADLYTYMRAKEAIGKNSFATLTRNFRSAPELIYGLNSLFQRTPRLIPLPKLGEHLPILPVEPALPRAEEGKIVFCESSDEESQFAFIIDEISSLHSSQSIPLHEFAVLVKDRYQAARFCSVCPLPYVLKRAESLLDSDALLLLKQLLEALSDVRGRDKIIKLLGGPLFKIPLEKLARGDFKEEMQLVYEMHLSYSRESLLSFFRKLVKKISFPSISIYLDLCHLVEILSEHCSYSEEYLPFLQKLILEDKESEHLRCRIKSTDDAIQVMTMHVSKGLEFSYVFPIGLMSPSDMNDEEDRSEKMRQLYVALTRAKKRAYLPVTPSEKSPMNFFLKTALQGENLASFAAREQHFSYVSYHKKLDVVAAVDARKQAIPEETYNFAFPASHIYSYSSLAEKKLSEHPLNIPENTLPVGAETGVLLHSIFEKIDFQLGVTPAFVEEMLKGTHLEAWARPVETLIRTALTFPLQTPEGVFSLSQVNPQKIKKEMEFLYSSETPKGYVKGFVDLFFEHQGKYYLIDWKSNFLEKYTLDYLKEAMEFHQYDLQAELYKEAVKRYLTIFGAEDCFGGVIYLFLRGLNPESKEGVYYYF